MIDTLKPFKDRKYIPVEEALKQLKAYKAPEKTVQPSTQDKQEFSIEEWAHGYTLDNVPFRGGHILVDWSKKRLDDNAAHNHEYWIEQSKKLEYAVPESPFSYYNIPDVAIYHACIEALYDNREHPDQKQKELVKKVKDMFANDFDIGVMVTSTKAAYSKIGPERIIHNDGYADTYITRAGLCGNNCEVSPLLSFDNIFDGLFHTADTKKILEIYQWAVGKKPYLGTLQEQPSENQSFPITLFTNQKFIINAINDLPGRARGVSVRKRSTK